MYDEFVKRLRDPCQYENCILCQQAADAIEELQKAVLRLEEASGILDELPMVDQRESPEEET